jgi:thiopeptide-type bacteriocin biosynthesis protein
MDAGARSRDAATGLASSGAEDRRTSSSSPAPTIAGPYGDVGYPRTHDSSWLYHKIYVGHVAGGLEYLITETLPKIYGREDIERWFFLRYFDHWGPHLRLRLKPLGCSSDLRRALNPIINEALGNLPRVPPPFYRSVISRQALETLPRGSVIRAIETEYEPEVAKFGAQGISVAERLFQLSSEIAAATLIDERADGCSRKPLVPIFMEAVRDAFVPTAGLSFWADYSKYWLKVGGESLDEWRPRFAAKARELMTRGVPVLMPEAALPQKARGAVHTWRTGLSQSVSEFDALQEPKRPGSLALAFNFIHLMNNRLGIMPIEEAYFSALLKEVTDR